MKPFFGLNNRLASILISFVVFGYAVYTIVSDGIVTTDQLRMVRLKDSSSNTFTRFGRLLNVKYNFESTTASLFGLYELEIAMIKVCVSFLLFIVLLLGATQRSKILLRIWMMINALVSILAILAIILSLTDNHIQGREPTVSFSKFVVTLAINWWFFAVVFCLHEEIEMKEQGSLDDRSIRSCAYVAKKGMEIEDKSPPYYDC